LKVTSEKSRKTQITGCSENTSANASRPDKSEADAGAKVPIELANVVIQESILATTLTDFVAKTGSP
jgi:hypothetical protein